MCRSGRASQEYLRSARKASDSAEQRTSIGYFAHPVPWPHVHVGAWSRLVSLLKRFQLAREHDHDDRHD